MDPGLLAAVLESPQDDAPRLVLADWLEEQGDPDRANWIRKGIANRKVVYVDNIPHRIDKRGKGHALGVWSRTVVNGWLPAPTTGGRCDIHFLRGFADAIECPAAWWLAHADAILACQPVTSVRLTTLPEMRLRRSGGGSGWQLYGNLRGREWPIPTLATDAERLMVALAGEWPGVAFTLPED